MGRYLAIADQALNEINVRSDANEKTNSPMHREKSELGERSLISVDNWSKRLQESPDNELRPSAGSEWDEISADQAMIIAFADNLAIVQIRESGGIPDHYTGTTECRHCGHVPIFEGLPDKVGGCPWCFNRIKGLPIPGMNK